MTQVTKELESVRLEIPEPLFKYNWDEAINATQDETVNLLKVCKMQCETLQKSRSWPTTPETLSWMTLWTRNFNLLQGTISVLESNVGIAKMGQELTLRMLWRPSFELWVTLNFIYNESAEGLIKNNIEKQTLGKRLCAYLAWCLWNDKEFAHRMTQGWRLDALFGEGKSIQNETEYELNQALEMLWGDENASDPADDLKAKGLVRKDSLNRRNQLQRWLQHEKLREFEKQIRYTKPSPLNYFGLVDPDNKSLANVLRSSWTDAGYPAYQEASSLIHGSTFEKHMELIVDRIYPRILCSDEAVQRQASHVRRFCHFNAHTLQFIQERIEREIL